MGADNETEPLLVNGKASIKGEVELQVPVVNLSFIYYSYTHIFLFLILFHVM